MSIQHMTLVLEAADLCAQEKAVMIAVCNHTDATGKTFASEQRLMREAGMPRTTFQRWRAKLVERELLISREKRSSTQRRLTNDTWVNLEALRAMRDPFFARAGREAADEDENPFDVSAGQVQAPSVGLGVASQAPSVGDPGSTDGAYPGPVSGAPNPQITLPSSIARAGEVAIDSAAGDDTATDDDGGETIITPDQAQEIVFAVQDVRGDWQAPGILAQLRLVAHLPFETVRDGFVSAARDTSVRAPMHLATSAQEIAAHGERKAAKDEERARGQEEWRRQVHDDAENRSKPETRAQMIQRLKDEKAHALAAKRQAAQGKPAGASRGAGTGGSV